MQVATLIVAVVALLLALVVVLASTEMANQLRALQNLVGYEDAPTRDEDLAEQLIGKTVHDLVPTATDVGVGGVLFLSTTCSTCMTIARAFRGKIPLNISLILEARSTADRDRWLKNTGLVDEYVIYDPGHRIADTFGVDKSPLLIRTVRGQIDDVLIPASYRSLQTLIADASPINLNLEGPSNESPQDKGALK